MAFALQARVVFPVDRPPIEHGVVTIAGERIVSVGTKTEASDVVDLGDVALLPGLVNAHTHLEFSHLKMPLGAPGMQLVDWIRLVITERGRGDYSAPLSIEDGIHESMGCGQTSIGDITSVDVPAHYFPRLDLTLFAEVIGFSRARAASALAAITVRLVPPAMPDHYARAIADIHLGVSPHAPYTVSPELLTSVTALARQRQVPVAMHVAESAEELELLRAGTGPFQVLLDERSMWDAEAIPHGSRPLDYLRMLAAVPRALVIHGNYLDAEERAFLAANADRMSLVYCPRTHAYFQHPPYPLPALLESGVHVALGTDSRASNPDLSLLAEMQFVAASFPSIDPQAVLRMGTLAGAAALGRDAEVGSITAGKTANLIAVSLHSQAAQTRDDALGAILAGDQRPCHIWIRGNEFTSNQV